MIWLWSDDVKKIFLSLLFGTLIGIERELSEKPAGLKTNVLICLGSTVFTLCAIKSWGAIPDFHIPAQILTGIGFLGAGAIMREGEQVTGLTTAAIIWVDAAIGMCIGFGFDTIAALTTLATLGIQIGLTPLDVIIDDYRQRLNLRIVSTPDDQVIEQISKIFEKNRIKVMQRKVMKKSTLYHSQWRTVGTPTRQENAAKELMKSEHIIEVTY